MKYRLVIFDFDGTLADSFPWFLKMANTIAEVYRIKRIDVSELDTLRKLDARSLVRHLEIPWWKVPLIANYVRRLAVNSAEEIAMFSGVDRVLQQLSEQGVILAVVTSNTDATVRRVLGPQNTALIRYFECSVSLFGKPRRFRKLLHLTGIPRSQTLVIGDEIRDYHAAVKERIPFGAATWGFTHGDALTALRPDEVFEQMDDILAVCT